MPTYNASAVSDSVIAHKKGITLQQIRALRDNYLAIAEGASGAPKISTKALSAYRGYYEFTENDTPIGFNIEGIAVLEVFYYVIITIGINGTGSFRFRLSANGGASFSSYVTLADSSSSTSFSGNLLMDLEQGRILGSIILNFTPLSNANFIEFSATASTNVNTSVKMALKEIAGYS